MGSLSFSATVSLDGFAADRDGGIDWTVPDADLFRLHVERMAAVSTEVLGRRTFLMMKYWDSEPGDGSWGPDEREFARRWRGIEKIAVSSTLTGAEVGSGGARLISGLTLPGLARIVEDAPGEVEIFGPTTAAAAIRAGMVRDFRFFVVPRVLGGGLRALPDHADLELRLVEHQVFGSGIVFLHYSSRDRGGVPID
ncbi:dihydrofolate reductase family protein [Corynebacterium pacaense]|uniref:dihydrofolate reductase family protein n=1 Tax=Corynebacterium pacaense TaxID=1816684 RepID=UPI0009BB4F2F|nr:dihydrofolate reductase family protein [Corynebacterium pacaense]